MLVFSAICPHPPILIPNIGKENLDQLQNTVTALKQLEQELIEAKPDIIVIISPHGELKYEAFAINFNPKYIAGFQDFGDWQTKLEFKNCPFFVSELKAKLEATIPLVLYSQENLDHGAAVPLFYLAQHLPEIEIVPINYCFLDYEAHWEIGRQLKEVIAQADKRIAVIASGDLSHCLTKDAPAPYSPIGQEFDKKLIKLLGQKDYKKIIQLEPAFIEQAAECGLRSFVIMFGLIEEYSHEVKILSYEGPFGVGYLVANFQLK